MGASVGAYWPGIEEELTEEQLGSEPGFFNGCKAWGNWMADRLIEPRTLEAIRSLSSPFRRSGVRDAPHNTVYSNNSSPN
jgi:hypothetical protein